METRRKPYSYEAFLGDEETALAKLHWRGMSKDKVLGWVYGMDEEFPLYAADIMFDGKKPTRKIVHVFNDIESVIEFMSEKSLTHNILFLSHHAIYISRSKDHQTNIDADILHKLMEVYR